ncbi:hypothetical protein PV328_011272 [Microctonus aethiopoides]|uniref:Uncharacterized protein n=1 Tax=Microctonus aethiopoides TaxID=144406 RepID=A0AA39F054_9HYME|nr:hypothetical protein PV328_011272 [Microctonus aethiopoides]
MASIRHIEDFVVKKTGIITVVNNGLAAIDVRMVSNISMVTIYETMDVKYENKDLKIIRANLPKPSIVPKIVAIEVFETTLISRATKPLLISIIDGKIVSSGE